MAAAAARRDAGERPHEVECVYIPETDRGTLCLSSQVGCTLNCSFCHTGTQRLVRNLTPGEIVGQVMVARDRLGDWLGAERATGPGLPTEGERFVSNIVMMGMGEPLYNFEAVRDAHRRHRRRRRPGISKRRITLSTSGVVPMIERAGAEIGCMLAISLHAVRDELRNELVPLNRKYPIEELLDACRNYPGVSNARRITFEYVMLKGVNDSLADAKALVRLLKGIPAKINLIPFNPWPGTDIRVLGLGADREILRGRVQRRLRLAGAHAARPRHPRRLRPAQERDREALRARAHGAARHGDDGLDAQTPDDRRPVAVPVSAWCRSRRACAICVAMLFVIAAHWNRFVALAGTNPAPPDDVAFLLLLLAPALVMSAAVVAMLAPAAIGALIAEAFAIRSWMFHVANGGLSAWIGWICAGRRAQTVRDVQRAADRR